MTDMKKIPQGLGVTLERVLGRDGARYISEIVEEINSIKERLDEAEQDIIDLQTP